MNIKEVEKVLEVIAEKEKNYDFNDYIKNYIDIEDIKILNNFDDVKQYLQDLNENSVITDTNVIYYDTAIEYLQENDSSLNQSIEIACEFGYELKDVNSELLASLLMSSSNRDNYSTFIDEVIKELII